MRAQTHHRLIATWGILVLGLGIAGCDSSSSQSPVGPSEVAQLPPPAPAPAGTVHLAGTVSDAAWRPLAGARVEVINGPEAGRFTSASATGQFSISGIFDETTLFRATHEGHVAATRPLPAPCGPCNPDWWIHFYLESAAPAVNLTGRYSLTFTADSTCGALPEAARSRTYDATIRLDTRPEGPANSRFDVVLDGESLVAGYDRFTIGVAGDYLVAGMGDGHGSAGLVEEVAAHAYVTLAGDMALTVTDPTAILASFRGVVEYCELQADWAARYSCRQSPTLASAQCESSNHRVELTRR